MLVALLTLGEGWHNCNHAFQSSRVQGFTLQAGRFCVLAGSPMAYRFSLDAAAGVSLIVQAR